VLRKLGDLWAEPFRSFVRAIPEETEIKPLELCDWPPPKNMRTTGRVALVGDALHAMAMCKYLIPLTSCSTNGPSCRPG
jgi:hypothetical protein